MFKILLKKKNTVMRWQIIGELRKQNKIQQADIPFTRF